MSQVQPAFPPELLSAPIQRRLRYFQDKIIGHAKIEATYSEVDSVIRGRGGKQLVFVVGPTGVGKTTLRRSIERKFVSDEANRMAEDRGYVPAIGLSLVAPGSGNFSWRDFYVRCLTELNEPMIMHKVDYASYGIRRNGDGKVTIGREATTEALRRAFENCLEHRHLRALLLDEGQHLLKMTSGRRLLDQMDALKSVSDMTGTVIVLFGTYQLAEFMGLSDQLRRRSEYLEFSRYCPTRDGITNFASFVDSLQPHLPLANPPDLVPRAGYLLEHSLGCVGLLKDWLTRSLCAALDAGEETLTERCLEKTRESDGVLRYLAETMLAGERDFHYRTDGPKDGVALLDVLSEGPPRSSEQPAAEKTSKRTAKRVGTRRPHRDRVGVSHGD